MSLDTRSLYPNFHAEATRHSSSSPRPTSSKGTDRKPHSQAASPGKRPYSKSRLPTASVKVGSRTSLSTSNNNQSGRAESPVKTSRRPIAKLFNAPEQREAGIPPLAKFVGSSGSRPTTSGLGLASMTRTGSEQRLTVRELSFKATQPIKHQQNLAFDDDLEQPRASTSHLPSRSRSVALRGELGSELTANAISSQEKLPPRVRTPSSSSLLRLSLGSCDLPLQEVVMCSARPRSRYARREIMTPIQPLRHGLTSSVSTPTLASDNVSGSRLAGSGTLGNGLVMRGSQSTGDIRPQTPSSEGEPTIGSKPPMISWTEQDASSFFLTEIDAKEAADQWKIARALASGSHFLYGRCEYEQAVACFADALTVVQEYENAVEKDHDAETSAGSSGSSYAPLLSLLHHHMGVAFKESAQDKWALLMQKKALELAQQCEDPKLQARALKALGVLFLDRNDPERALDCQQQALKIATETLDSELEARVYANLGNLAAVQQQLHHAVSCHARDLISSSTPPLDSAVGQARAHRNLSLVYAKMDGRQDEQLDHELHAARLVTANAFETDMRRHPGDVIGNIYCQLSRPDPRLVDMVATSLTEVLTAKEDDEDAMNETIEPHKSA